MKRRRTKRPLRRLRCAGRIDCYSKRADAHAGLPRLKGSPIKLRTARPAHVPGGAALFQRVYTRLGCEGRPPRFRVEFYSYSSLVLTIRRREDAMMVRL